MAGSGDLVPGYSSVGHRESANGERFVYPEYVSATWEDATMSARMPCMRIEVREGDDWIEYSEVPVSQRSFCLPLAVAPLVERDVLAWLVNNAREVWLVQGTARKP